MEVEGTEQKRRGMNKLLAWTVLLLLVLTLATWAGQSLTLVGKVVDIDGPLLTTNRLTEERWFQGYVQMPTFLDERLRTGDDTLATVQFYLGGRAVISPGSEVEIVSERSLQTLHLRAGKVWAQFDKQERKDFQIQTPGGVIGIEGTEFFVEAEPTGETTLTVVEGKVRISSGESEKLVLEGEEASFHRGIRRHRRYANFRGKTLKERRLEAFKKISGLPPRFQHQVLAASRPGHYKKYPVKRLWRKSISRKMRLQRKQQRDNNFDILSTGQTEGRPTATWHPHPTRSYAVVVSTDQQAEEVLWSTATRLPRFSYPAYGPELDAGTQYYLSVVPLRADETPVEDSNGVLVGAQATFESSGHQPTYSAVTGLRVEEDPSGRPLFHWDSSSEFGRYRIQLSDDSTVLWADEVENPLYLYPLSARALEPGSYQVVVEALDHSGVKMGESRPLEFPTGGWEAEGVEGPARK